MSPVVRRSCLRFCCALSVLLGLAGCGPSKGNGRGDRGEKAPIPVEFGIVTRGPIALRRSFTGTLQSSQDFLVSSKVGGSIEELFVDLADRVERGQVVARLDSEEYKQALARAQADLSVAHAKKSQAESALGAAERSMQRVRELREQQAASIAEFDSAEAELLTKRAAVQVAVAEISRADAALESAKIRLGYTEVTAEWSEGDSARVVAERRVSVGDTITANTSLFRVVELDPLVAIIFVTERDYGRLAVGNDATLTTDMFPGEQFQSRILRIAPVFRQSSRQARVELRVENPGERLRPGMFIRAEIILDREDDALIVPFDAITQHRDKAGVFVISRDGLTVRFAPVGIGIRDRDRIAVRDVALEPNDTRIVTLGQQLLDDGAKILLATPEDASKR